MSIDLQHQEQLDNGGIESKAVNGMLYYNSVPGKKTLH